MAHNHWTKKENHTKLKHNILQFYLQRWAKILADSSHSTNQQNIYYIDGFAGRGIFLDNELGSPLIAADEMHQVQQDFNGKFPHKYLKFHVINIENEIENYDMLEHFRTYNPTDVNITNYFGNFINEANKLKCKPFMKKPNYCFWFVDPFYGVEDFTFEDIVSLLFTDDGEKRLRKELLINFVTLNVLRNLYNSKQKNKVLRFIGAKNWDDYQRFVLKFPNNKEKAMVEFYKHKLRECGLFVLSQRIQCKDPTEKDADKFYFEMIHCSHNIRALMEMRDTFWEVQQQKETFEKELKGEQIDFFDIGVFNTFEMVFDHNAMIKLINENYGFKVSLSLYDLLILVFQEVPLHSERVLEILHDLWESNVIEVFNLDDKNRKKPFKRNTTEWHSIEIKLLKREFIHKPVFEQMNLF